MIIDTHPKLYELEELSFEEMVLISFFSSSSSSSVSFVGVESALDPDSMSPEVVVFADAVEALVFTLALLWDMAVPELFVAVSSELVSKMRTSRPAMPEKMKFKPFMGRSTRKRLGLGLGLVRDG